MALNYQLDTSRGEVIFCGGCNYQWGLFKIDSWKCPTCKSTLVSWYTKNESTSDAINKWKRINGK
jgi:hypothetical protein